jgi:hypothetical protein
MDDPFDRGAEEFTPNGAGYESIAEEVEKHFECNFPESYKRFMTECDGGEGFVGDRHLILWRMSELIGFNMEYEVAQYASGLLIFGSNGGGEAFAFDIRDAKMKIVMVPFIGMNLEYARPLAGTFENFLSNLAHEKPT